jgi:hypothetical protein
MVGMLQTVHAASPGVTLAWDRSTETNVVGYIVHFGLSSRQYSSSINVADAITNAVTGLTPGTTYFFAVTAYDTFGLESEPSNEVSYSVPTSTFSLKGLPASVMVNKNTSASIPFTVDGSTGSNMSFRVTSSNPKLLPVNRIGVQAAGTNCTLSLSPIWNKSGRLSVTLFANEDWGALSHTMAVTVTASNNPPTITAPVSLATARQAALTLSGVRVNDVDTKTANLRLTLTAAHGTIKLRTTVSGGITAAQVKRNGSANVTITAPAKAMNRTFAVAGGLVYRGNLNFVGADSVVAVLNDRGNVGVGGAKSCTTNISLSIQGDAYDVWRNLNFSEADLRTATAEQRVWGDQADPDADGRGNLLEYALGSDPNIKQASTNGLLTTVVQTNAAAYHALTFNRRMTQTVVTYVPEVSFDGETWSGDVEVWQTQPVNASFEGVTYRDVTPVSSGAVRLMRLTVVRSGAISTSEVFIATGNLIRGVTNVEPVITPVAVPFVVPSVYEGIATAVVSNRLVDVGAGWTPDQFGRAPHCAEFASGQSIRIVVNDTNSLVLEQIPSPAVLAGSRFRVRPLLTVEGLFGQGGLLGSGNDIASADNILLFDPATQQTRTMFWSTAGNEDRWRDQDGNDGDNEIVPSHSAVLVRRRGAGDILLVGHGVVSRIPPRVAIYPGLNWLAAPPVGGERPLTQLGLSTGDAATGIAGGPDATSADTLMVFSMDGNPIYFYCTARGLEGWRDLGMALAPTNAVDAGSAIMMERKAPRPGFAWRMPSK